MNKNVLMLIAIVLTVAWGFSLAQPEDVEVSPAVQIVREQRKSSVQEILKDKPEMEQEKEASTFTEKEEPTEQPGKVEIPKTFQLDVPFIVQAPFADWNEVYKEACEEASVAMVHRYAKGDQSLTEDEMKFELDFVLAWGDETFEGRFDTNADETAQYLMHYYDYQDRVHVIEDPSIDDIKAVIASGYPVIVPAAGQLLGNRFFREPGPVYHMLVITGYDHDEFITNDPGTKNGEGYRYKQEVLYEAIHDWTGDYDSILQGRKTMIVLTD